jgi:hypothetical protein
MPFKAKYPILALVAGVILLLTGFSGEKPELPVTGFWAMKGTLLIHHFDDKSDSLSGPEIYELQDSSGLPIWFCRHIFRDVCISGECKMIRLWLFWDGAGNYLGLQLYEGEPLTKSDHTEFNQADYDKMNNILGDTASILKDLKQEDLIIVPDNKAELEVDGYTAATQPTLAEVVVKDAVYTCYTLWHTVYGPVQNEIRHLLNQRLSEPFLLKMFYSTVPEYVLWAIQAVKNFPEYHTAFYTHVLKNIQSEDPVVATQALNYFQPQTMAGAEVKRHLTGVIPTVSMIRRYEILWKFITQKVNDEEIILDLLKMFEQGVLDVGAFQLILQLLNPEHLKNNEEIAAMLQMFSENENRYVSNLAQKALREKFIPAAQ